MKNICKNNLKILLTALVSLLFFQMPGAASRLPGAGCGWGGATSERLSARDTVPLPSAASSQGLLPADSLPSDTLPADSLSSDSSRTVTDTMGIRYSKDTLAAPVSYHADDSVVLIVPQKKLYLYNNANIDYQEINLKAGKVEFDQADQTLKALYRLDT